MGLCQSAEIKRLKRENAAQERQLRQRKDDIKALQKVVNDLPPNIKIQSMPLPWPFDFIQMANQLSVETKEPLPNHLYARVFTQQVGTSLIHKKQHHVQFLNDPDPERKWQRGHKFKLMMEVCQWQEDVDDEQTVYIRQETHSTILLDVALIAESKEVEWEDNEPKVAKRTILQEFAKKYPIQPYTFQDTLEMAEKEKENCNVQ